MLRVLYYLIYSLFVLSFEAKLPEIFKDIHEAYEKIDARLKAEQFKVYLSLRLLHW